jgi:hypothetical protein
MQIDGDAKMLEKVTVWGGSMMRDKPKIFCAIYTHQKVFVNNYSIICRVKINKVLSTCRFVNKHIALQCIHTLRWPYDHHMLE